MNVLLKPRKKQMSSHMVLADQATADVILDILN